jgi:hypothetical protein
MPVKQLVVSDDVTKSPAAAQERTVAVSNDPRSRPGVVR